MRKTTKVQFSIVIIAVILLIAAGWDTPAVFAGLEYEDLNNWTEEGDSSADWEIEPGGRTAVQHYNGSRMYFLSPNSGSNITIQGTLLQSDTLFTTNYYGDGDVMGYVFGYQDTNNYYLFEWYGPDSSTDMTLYEVSSGSRTEIDDYDFLDWAKDVTYEVRILYMEDLIRVSIDGTTYLEAVPADAGVSSFPEGKYGFYNYSQGAVQYGNVRTAPGSLTEDPPVAADDTYGMDENTSLNVDRFSGLLANDYDPNLDDFTLTVNGTTLTTDGSSTSFDPGHGWVTVYGDGHFSYTPDTNFTGTDSFTYYLTDNDGNSNTATVTFNVMEVNQPPTDIDLSNNQIVHNSSLGTVIGSFSTTDPNATDSHDYLLLDNGGGRFGVSGSNLTVANQSLLTEGSYTIEVRSTDLRGAYYDETFSINVTDQAPTVANPILDVSVNEDAPDLNLDLSTVFADPDDDDSAINKAVYSNTNSSVVSASIFGNSLTLDFLADQSGSGVITIRGTSNGKTVDDSFNITVTAINDDPVITEGASTGVTMDEDGSPTDFSLTLNATDADPGDTLTWSISSPAAHGTATVSGTGTSKAIGYTPDVNYNGSDSFEVQVSDGNGGTDQITVNVTINPVDDPPVLETSPGLGNWTEDGSPIVVDPGLTISDPDGGNISEAQVSITNLFPGDMLTAGTFPGISSSYNSSTGVLTMTGNGTPADYQSYLRSIEFYSSQDEPDLTDREITFTIGSAIAGDHNGHFYEYVAASGLTWNAARTAAEGLTLYGLQGYLATVTSAEENATIADKLSGNGWMGASDSAAEGTWRWVTGPEGLEDSGAGRHFFTQTSSHMGTSYGGATPGGGFAVGGYYNNWRSGEPNDWSNSEDVAHFYSDDGTWNDFAYNNTSIQGYVVEYGGMPGETLPQITDTRSLQITAVNDTPVCYSVSLTTDEDSSGSTSPNCQDDENDPLTYQVTQPVQGASAAVGSSLNFDPDGDFESLAVGESNTTDGDFTYTAYDGETYSNSAAVAVTVTGLNDSPSAVDDAVSTDEDTPLTTIDLVADNDTDPDGSDVLSVFGPPDTSGTIGLAASNGDGTFDYDPNGQFEYLAVGDSTTDTFTYTISDGNGGTDTATVMVTVSGVNDPPTPQDDSDSTLEDTPVTINVMANDSDIDSGDTFEIVSVSQGGNGSVSFTSGTSGDVTYSPNPNYFGSDSFTYTIRDSQGGEATASVDINISSTHDMIVNGNGITIGDGDSTPSSSDGTDFGSTALFQGTVDRTFEIENLGNIDLNLTGSPRVEISGSNPGDFTVTTLPSSPIASGGTGSFLVEFDPSAEGTRSAQILIEYDDNATAYQFAIQGSGVSHDSDSDGVIDNVEEDADRDGDGITNFLDYDPSGYFYDEKTGEIISGGLLTVTGPGAVNVIEDGSGGYYQFLTDGTAGTYTLTITLPGGYDWSRSCLPGDPPPFDPTGQSEPVVLGNGEDGSTGFLSSNACTVFYESFDLESGDPMIFNNNFPLRKLPLPDTGFAPGLVTELAPQPLEKQYQALDGFWLEIPDLDLQTELVGVPAVDGDWDTTWLGDQAGYLEGTAFPTWAGNTVITGHVWNADNTPGVFVDLKNLAYGDEIMIHAFGSTYVYQVQNSRRISPHVPGPVFEHKDGDWLTLFTCEIFAEYWEDYSYRRMVQAVLVRID